MRITARLVLALLVAATAVAAGSTWFNARQEKARLIEDLDRRSAIFAESFSEAVEPGLKKRDAKALQRLVQRFENRERLAGLAVCDAEGKVLAATAVLTADLSALEPGARDALASGTAVSMLARLARGESHAYFLPLPPPEAPPGLLILVHDASYIDLRLRLMWRNNFIRLLVHALLISLVSLWIIRWNFAAPVAQLAEWMKKLRVGEIEEPPRMPRGLLDSVASEAASLAKSLSAAKAAAEEEARLRQHAETIWTPERLKEHAKAKLEGRPLFVVANREPYMHVRQGRKIEILTPASGLVTGVEPILRACGGTWIAHGSGDADRETADARGRLQVPPGEPRYTLRRVWLSKEEEEGYYYGFSNEGLWPLCHIAHARPTFKAEDWRQYQAVNIKFAKALLEEIGDEPEPFVLIQDYHYALLPRLIKQARPKARVAIFWHIPWPNPEAFGICPWQRDILEGMLGADVIGFHIQFHCNNFLETVDRALESRIDWERFAVLRGGHATSVKPYPISIAFPAAEPARAGLPGKEALLKELGVKAEFLGVGVDRVDYTKGIVERFRAIERLLEKYPEYQGRFAFVEIGAPSRTHIPRYRDLQQEVEKEAYRINWRFQSKDYKPIVLINKHHSHEEIEPYYKAADLCLVTSLHDGMNLVAKEFVAAREDESGVLVLSRFTGAARELREALIVNPYDIEQSAEALRLALEMEPGERARRMTALRRVVREKNVYYWAGSLISDLAGVRLPVSPPASRV